jgi:hypothetical protein
MQAIVFAALAAVAGARDLQCPAPPAVGAVQCFQSFLPLGACCMWNVPEDLMGTSFLKEFAIALGASESQATLGAAIPCSQILQVGTCNETVAENAVLGPLFTSPSAVAIAESARVAAVCAASCKNDTFSQGLFGSLCGTLQYVPTPQDNASVYDCQYTTTEEPATTEGETSMGTTEAPKASGTTQADVGRDTDGASGVGLHHVAAIAAAAMVSLRC